MTYDQSIEQIKQYPDQRSLSNGAPVLCYYNWNKLKINIGVITVDIIHKKTGRPRQYILDKTLKVPSERIDYE